MRRRRRLRELLATRKQTCTCTCECEDGVPTSQEAHHQAAVDAAPVANVPHVDVDVADNDINGNIDADVISDYSNYTARRDEHWKENGTNGMIPHVLHRVFTSRRVTQRFREVLDKAGQVDPSLEFTFADFPTAEAYISARCGPRIAWAFRMLLPGAYKADLYRCCVLYAEGGYYADIGMQLMAPVASFVNDNATFVVAVDPGLPGRGLLNGFLGSVRGHPVMREMMVQIVRHVEACWYTDDQTVIGALAVSGPELLGRVVREIYGDIVFSPGFNDTSGIQLLPADKDTPAAGLTIHVRDPVDYSKEIVRDKFPGQTDEFRRMGYMVRGAEHYSILWAERKVYSALHNCPRPNEPESSYFHQISIVPVDMPVRPGHA
eukprot:jgi/Mesvir1/4006/Mv03700-RA.1